MKSGFVRRLFLGAALALPMLGGAAVAQADGEHFVFVSHAPDSDSWWNVIKNALKDAEKDFGVKVDYRNPSTGDLADMARIIEQATAQKPAGIITTIADYSVLEGPLKAAMSKGIPVITVNSGTAAESKKLGALMHIGQPEYDAGKGAGERAKAAGVTKFLCVNHYITNNASVERCQGYADGLGVKLGDQMIDSGMDPTDVYNRVKAYLTANPDTDGILTLGPNSADLQVQELHHLRPRQRHQHGDQGRPGRIRDRPAALSAGLSRRCLPGEVRAARHHPGQQRQHRPGLRDQGQHRPGREVRRRIPLTPRNQTAE
jgi:simple sugar transport system substrate-binding protein